MTKIIVGVDESEGAREALRWAHREGQLRAWPVTAVLAWDLLNQHGAGRGEPFDPAYGEEDARAALDAVVVAALGADGAAGVERRTVLDLPARALIDAAGPEDVLVVGARGLGGFRGLLLGSVSQHALHHARCPVVVVRSPDEAGAERHERIVVGFDGSDPARRALRWALEEGVARGASVEVVHAWHLPPPGAEPLAAMPYDADALQDDAERRVDAAVERALAEVPGAEVERTVVPGDAAASILDAAGRAHLVVVGSRGIGGFGGLLLGSVSQKVARHAPCPVLVVHAAG